MKTTLVLVLGAHGQTIITVDNSTNTNYRDAFMDDTNFDGVGDSSSAGTGGFSGGDNGALSIEKLAASGGRERQISLFFALPTLTAGQFIQNATLRLYLSSRTNDNSTTATLGPVSLFTDVTQNSGNVAASDFNGGTDTGLDLANSASPTGQYLTLNVTSFVQADYTAEGNSGAVSYFRLEMDNAAAFSSTGGTGDDRYLFVGGTGVNRPQLVVTVIPEPSSIALLGSEHSFSPAVGGRRDSLSRRQAFLSTLK